MFSSPDAELLKKSHGTLWVCKEPGTSSFEVVKVKEIQSVVAMVPWVEQSGEFFMMEKLGLEVASMGGVVEVDEEVDGGYSDD